MSVPLRPPVEGRRPSGGWIARIAVMAVGIVAVPGCGGPSTLAPHVFSGEHMGTRVRLTLWSTDPVAAAEVAGHALRDIGRLDSLFSDYRTDSEIGVLAEAAGDADLHEISRELADVLGRAREWSARTDGAFDVTMGSLTRLWRWSARRGELPDSARLRSARARTGWAQVELDVEGTRARLTQEGMSLDLGGIAKGWTADRVLARLRAEGFPVAVVDLGGDVALGDPPPGRDEWRVEVPGGVLTLPAGRAVATSGDAHRHLIVEGVRYAHVVDPATGLGVVEAPTVVVVADDATTADVLASALTVLSPGRGRAVVEGVPGASARVVDPTGAVWQSEGFPGLYGGSES